MDSRRKRGHYKTKSAHREAVLAKLKASRLPFEATLDHLASSFPAGRDGFMEMMRFACGIESGLAPIVQAWDDLPRYKRRITSLDTIAQANAKLDVAKIAGVVTESSVRYGMNLSNMLAGMAHPRIVQASIRRALEPDGIEDRKVQLMQLGFLPCENSIFNLSAAAGATTQSVGSAVEAGPGLPPFETEAVQFSKLIREDKEKTEDTDD